MKMHPEDVEIMRDAKEYARKYAVKFCFEHLEELIRVIATYEDVRAEEKFEKLREKFWLREWEYEGR